MGSSLQLTEVARLRAAVSRREAQWVISRPTTVTCVTCTVAPLMDALGQTVTSHPQRRATKDRLALVMMPAIALSHLQSLYEVLFLLTIVFFLLGDIFLVPSNALMGF